VSDAYWIPSLVYVCDSVDKGCDPAKNGKTIDPCVSAGASANVYYKGYFGGDDCAVATKETKEIVPGGGGVFDGGGAAHHYELAGVANLLGVAIIVGALLHFIRRVR